MRLRIFKKEISFSIEKISEIERRETKELFTDIMEYMISHDRMLIYMDHPTRDRLLSYIQEYNNAHDNYKNKYLTRHIEYHGCYNLNYEELDKNLLCTVRRL